MHTNEVIQLPWGDRQFFSIASGISWLLHSLRKRTLFLSMTLRIEKNALLWTYHHFRFRSSMRAELDFQSPYRRSIAIALSSCRRLMQREVLLQALSQGPHLTLNVRPICKSTLQCPDQWHKRKVVRRAQ